MGLWLDSPRLPELLFIDSFLAEIVVVSRRENRKGLLLDKIAQ